MALTPILTTLITLPLIFPQLSSAALLGPQYPHPTSLPSQPPFQSALSSFTTSLTANLTQSPYNSTTFSLAIFSTSDEPGQLAWEYHHASTALAAKGGVEVDAEAVYRIGSISKLLTIYLFLVLEGDRLWNEPVARYLPELADLAGEDVGHAVPDWGAITVGDVAGQVAGLSRNCMFDPRAARF